MAKNKSRKAGKLKNRWLFRYGEEDWRVGPGFCLAILEQGHAEVCEECSIKQGGVVMHDKRALQGTLSAEQQKHMREALGSWTPKRDRGLLGRVLMQRRASSAVASMFHGLIQGAAVAEEAGKLGIPLKDDDGEDRKLGDVLGDLKKRKVN